MHITPYLISTGTYMYPENTALKTSKDIIQPTQPALHSSKDALRKFKVHVYAYLISGLTYIISYWIHHQYCD